MTALIIGILSGVTQLASTLMQSQTPAQQAVLWDRYIALTQPLHLLLIKLEGLILPAAAITAPPVTPPVLPAK